MEKEGTRSRIRMSSRKEIGRQEGWLGQGRIFSYVGLKYSLYKVGTSPPHDSDILQGLVAGKHTQTHKKHTQGR